MPYHHVYTNNLEISAIMVLLTTLYLSLYLAFRWVGAGCTVATVHRTATQTTQPTHTGNTHVQLPALSMALGEKCIYQTKGRGARSTPATRTRTARRRTR
jgi:hypothetical protein